MQARVARALPGLDMKGDRMAKKAVKKATKKHAWKASKRERLSNVSGS